MSEEQTLAKLLQDQGVSRRGFLKFCAGLATMMALPASMAPTIAEALENAKRPSVIWLSFQECTGCTESLTRSHSPTLENLIFDVISLDYHHTLMAPSGTAAEDSRLQAIKEHYGKYLLVVDGSIPIKDGGAYSTIAGISNLDMLKETAAGAAAIISVGTCAAYGGLPYANPNPTGAVSVSSIIRDKPIINIPGCPPIPVVIPGVLAHYLPFGKIPELDNFGRPLSFYGVSVHDHCYRRTFYEQGKFAKTFDDEGARKGWCLYELGCKGPDTHNACATEKWNQGTSFPIQSGHGCIGCSEPGFWDAGSLYKAIPKPPSDISSIVTPAFTAGAAAGIAVDLDKRMNKARATKLHQKVTNDDLQN